MFEDYKNCYATLNLPTIPTKDSTIWPVAPAGNSTISKHGIDILTDEMNDIFSQKQLIVDFVLLWTWNLRIDDRPRYSIHSDGHYTDINPRKCAINWAITGESVVEWWSHTNGIPSLTQKNDAFYKVTDWKWIEGSNPIKLTEWNGKLPAVLNIRQPHSVKVISGPRKSVTIRFKNNPDMDQILYSLKDNIIDIN